jgi:hypothetical protein
MNKANYTDRTERNFPLSTQGLDFIQQQVLLAAQYAKTAGGNYILSGCQEVGMEVSSGILIIAGEIIPFTGGVKQEKIRIVETHEDITAGGNTYEDAYIKRRAEFGSNLDEVDTYPWTSFLPFPTNHYLMELFDVLSGHNHDGVSSRKIKLKDIDVTEQP